MEDKLTAFNRILAITDVETTGLDWERHEIIEIGLLTGRQDTLEVLGEFEIKVRPDHIEDADPRSLQIAGYTPSEWKDAVSLRDAMQEYADRVRDSLFLAHPVTMDYAFIDRGFRKAGIQNPLHYHQLDLFSMAWILLKEDVALPKVTLMELTRYFDLEPEPMPHRAIEGARLAHRILKELVRRGKK
jgi:DNA polymerase III epsilon subunit-like protein